MPSSPPQRNSQRNALNMELKYKDGTLMYPKMTLNASHQRYLLYDPQLRRPGLNNLPERRKHGEEMIPRINISDPNSEYFIKQQDSYQSPILIKNIQKPIEEKIKKYTTHQADPTLLTQKLDHILKRQESYRKLFGAPIYTSKTILHGQPPEYSYWGPPPIHVPGLKNPTSLKFIMPLTGVELPEVTQQLKILKEKEDKIIPKIIKVPTRIYKIGTKEFVSLSNSMENEFYKIIGKNPPPNENIKIPKNFPKNNMETTTTGNNKNNSYTSKLTKNAKAKIMKLIMDKRAEEIKKEKLIENEKKNKLKPLQNKLLATQLSAIRIDPKINLRLPLNQPKVFISLEYPKSIHNPFYHHHHHEQNLSNYIKSIKFPSIILPNLISKKNISNNTNYIDKYNKTQIMDGLPNILDEYHMQRMDDIQKLDKPKTTKLLGPPTIRSDRNSPLVFNVRLNGKETTPAVLDTALSFSLITKRLVDKLSLTKYMVPQYSSIKVIHSLSPMLDPIKYPQVLGSIHSVRVRVGLANPIIMNFQVVQEAQCDCVLGVDFVRTSRAVVNLNDEMIIFDQGKIRVHFMTPSQVSIMGKRMARYFGTINKIIL